MNGEIALGGVFFPTLLLVVALALVLAYGLTRILAALGFYHFVSYRALVDSSIVILLTALLAWLFPQLGFRL